MGIYKRRSRVRASAGIFFLVCFLSSSFLNVRTSLQSENRGLGSRLSWRWSGAPVLPSPENEIISSKAVVGGVDDFYMKGAALWRKGTVECPLPAEAPGDYMKLQNIFSLEKEWKGNVSNILLAETSCNMKPSYRAWCAVESMVQQNPQSLVWYVMTSKVVNLRQGVAGRLLEHYHNLRLVTVGLRQVFHNTPLMDLYTSTSWTHNTTWPAVSLSNMIRLALVWHVGGLYSDNDVVCIAPLTHQKNVIGLYDDTNVNNAVFHFDRHHPMLEAFMSHLNENFSPNVWGFNGPMMMTKVLKTACGKELAAGDVCQGVTLLHKRNFYPLPVAEWKIFFTALKGVDVHKMFPNSYVIHKWNKMSHSQPVFKDSGMLYDETAKVFCPITREIATHVY
ncbi:lactosylceramide 4-alpha-galactosyltransferase-like [Homarus americanus]|uniref:lactosylceramide 4-alpha-galactosyltransferase-like n=1 Tax=Homarus americanus TaxID=6706 RepID=UPI001C449F2D|nr:lactosylceramide 4-alpha-galactosyltransferase-like [Homarus americanus]